MTDRDALHLFEAVQEWLGENYDVPSRLALVERFKPLRLRMNSECETAGHWLFLAFHCLFQVLQIATPDALGAWIEAAEQASRDPRSPSAPS